ncbi:NUDIX hydrolase [Actinomycetospora sp. NBRC 106378]|uniref:NUDIX hydrolase n=1 Tax=Actinomycetospora sp. NBRC 106378 TaxID=3032208 RepID=UPI002555FC0E|nr:NUDIX hydrolase [Actinomycetospora sp. NBRC 106378]
MDTPKHSVSVAGIVVDDQDRVLVIQRRDNGHWEPPGGVLELEETPEDGVRREVFEETGIQVSVKSLSGVYKNVSRGVVALVYRCTAEAGSPRVSDETVRVEWKSFADAISGMDDVYAIRVEDAIIGETSASRSHDGVRLY